MVIIRWPRPTETPQQPCFATYTAEQNLTIGFDKLPVELLLVILNQTSFLSYLYLSSTCKFLRSLLTAPHFVDLILKEAIVRGQFRWISPVEAMPAEVDCANEIFNQWISVYSARHIDALEKPPSRSNTQNPLLLPNFPRLAFIHACYQSDSMMNRLRIWGIVKQYEALWMNYRTNGWKKKRFYHKSD